MKITFLGSGTSQGVPLIGCDCVVCTSKDAKDNRLRSSVMIIVDGLNLVIDTGPDFRQQMLREKVKKVDAVIYTHEHKDHIAGLDDIRGFNFKWQSAMPLYASERVFEAIKREFAYIFSDYKYPGIPSVELHTLHNAPFSIGETIITPIQVMHAKLPVFGYRIRNFTYITDANYISDAELEKIKGSEVIVLNALRREEHISHYTFQQAIDLLTLLNPKKAYLTHISHQLGLHEEVSSELPSFIELAYDGLTIDLE